MKTQYATVATSSNTPTTFTVTIATTKDMKVTISGTVITLSTTRNKGRK